MKKTALTDIHRQLGAKMVEFAGYEMPIQYSSIRSEHLHVRNAIGVFDVSHMGEFYVTGPDREAFVDYVTVNDVKGLNEGQVHYSCACRPHAVPGSTRFRETRALHRGNDILRERVRDSRPFNPLCRLSLAQPVTTRRKVWP